jgi:hypothetical protein
MPSARNVSELRHVLKLPYPISGLEFSKGGKSLVVSAQHGLIVFHRNESTGCFIPRLRDVRDRKYVVEDLTWSGPMKIDHRRPMLQEQTFRTDVFTSWRTAQGLSGSTNYTICHHWKSTTNCDGCREKEALYSDREEIEISREVEGGGSTYTAKVRGCFVEIWSSRGPGESVGTLSGSDGPHSKKRSHDSGSGEADSGKAKQVKVEKPNEDSDSDVVELEVVDAPVDLKKILPSE